MKIHVLVVEPDELLLESYRNCLAKHGFEVATAQNGPVAIRLLNDFAPHVVVLEPELPDAWGDRLLEMIRDDPRMPSVPVIVLTRLEQRTYHHPVQPARLDHNLCRLNRMCRRKQTNTRLAYNKGISGSE